LGETEIFAEGYSFHKKQDDLYPGDIQFQYGGITSSADIGTFSFLPIMAYLERCQ
jgi:hypothetical protein